jgi:hypothetical protein
LLDWHDNDLAEEHSVVTNRALLVGINQYRDAPLRGCINDVADVRDFLSSAYNFAAEDIRVLLDSAATSANIKQHLRSWLTHDAAANDRLVFHFSGHGTQLPGQDGSIHDVVCPVDFDFTERTALSDVDFSEMFKAIPAEAHFVWISDSCHSGDLARGRAKVDAIPRYLPPPPQIMAQIDALHVRGATKRGLNGVIERLKGLLIAGCQSHETSADAVFNGRYNGALSYYLLKVLRGDGVRLRDIETVLESVQSALDGGGYDQHPQLRGLPELRRKPFLGFPDPGGDANAIASADVVAAQDGGIASVERFGDGQSWDEAFERAATPKETSRGEAGWDKVHWAADDASCQQYA